MTTPLKDRPFDRTKGPVRVRGVAWQRDPTTTDWRRHMLRVHGDGTPYWSTTYRLVDAELPFCMKCLSINVTFEQGLKDGYTVWCCHSCDVGYFVLLADDDASGSP